MTASAGVLYLAWLGIKLWKAKPLDLGAALATAEPLRGRVAFRRSLTVALSNPKTLLFFAAFLPQFVSTAHAQGPQYLVLGASFVAIARGIARLPKLRALRNSRKHSPGAGGWQTRAAALTLRGLVWEKSRWKRS